MATASPNAPAPAPITRRSDASTETKAAFRTTELVTYVLAVVAVLIAAMVVDETDAGGFGAQQAWLYVTLLTVGYMVSRGLAKSARNAAAPATGRGCPVSTDWALPPIDAPALSRCTDAGAAGPPIARRQTPGQRPMREPLHARIRPTEAVPLVRRRRERGRSDPRSTRGDRPP